MKKFYLLILLFTLKIHSQEVLKKNEIYSKNNLTYKVANSELFTGKIQSFKGKDHLTFELEFENGILKKSIEYFNGKKQIVANETYYKNANRQIEKKIKYSLNHKYLWIKYFDENGNKKLEEEYSDGKLIYSCPYLENKKNGIAFSINEKGEKIECKFKNGKLIKN